MKSRGFSSLWMRFTLRKSLGYVPLIRVYLPSSNTISYLPLTVAASVSHLTSQHFLFHHTRQVKPIHQDIMQLCAFCNCIHLYIQTYVLCVKDMGLAQWPYLQCERVKMRPVVSFFLCTAAGEAFRKAPWGRCRCGNPGDRKITAYASDLKVHWHVPSAESTRGVRSQPLSVPLYLMLRRDAIDRSITLPSVQTKATLWVESTAPALIITGVTTAPSQCDFTILDPWLMPLFISSFLNCLCPAEGLIIQVN